jgi:hypothetical protein
VLRIQKYNRRVEVDENVSFSSSIEERVVTEWDDQRRFESPSKKM